MATVVIGYDNSTGGQAALQWAAAEAQRLHARLRIVQVFELIIATRPSPGKIVPLAGLRTARERGLHALADGIRAQHPDLVVQTVLVDGSPAEVLLGESAQATMIVLGSRGLGGWSGLLVGSVAVQVSTHAQCPVVVVRPEQFPRPHERPAVVVGVDGSKTSAKAIDFAFDQAEARGAELVAVHAWTRPSPTDDGGEPRRDLNEQDALESGRLLVAESIAGALADHPDVQCDTRLVVGHPAHALVLAGESAELVVVGSRGRGGFTGLLLGSTSQNVLHHAPCPVAIVR
ncbi:universal stress protein [Kribbella sp. NPDC051137]|jgi:nucleotide-binding universal stress UspA family protein|uniref:universal stress protein n=1 Tax=Kribbella sp. NPDC051137 TaxID=3155045 RepID=UPI002F590128